jgi:hypothetical protein
MNLISLSDPILLLESHIHSSKQILRESCDGLTSEQRRVVENIHREFLPLIEASLTTTQVKQIFGAVEKQAVAGGGSRTLAGKGVDVAKKANDIINSLGKKLQDTAPVKAFDQKFDQLKDTINKKFPDSKLLDGISNLGIWAKENPGKTAAIIGVLTAIASIAGGPVGGAIAGQVLRGTTELLKGEKLSTAVGKGLKTAAIGWLAGMTMDKVGDMISSIYRQYNPVPITGFAQYYESNVGNGLPNVFRDATIYGNKEQLGQFRNMWGEAVKQWKGGDFEGAREAFGQAQQFAAEISNATLNQIAVDGDPAEKIQLLNQALSGLSAAAQGAASGATAFDKQGKPVENSSGKPRQESYYIQKRPLSEGQVYMIFGRVERLDEGPMDLLKKAGGAVAKGAAWAGKQATEKITSAKLLASWKLEGSPTDSEELAKFLQGQGVGDDIVNQVYTDMKLPVSGQGAALEPAETWAYTNPTTGTKYEAGTTKDGQLIINFDGEWETVEDEADRKAILAAKDKPAGAVDFETVKKMLSKVRARDRAVLAMRLQKEIGASA